MGPPRAATQRSTEKSFFGCCQLAEWDLIIGIMRTDFHCFNLGEGMRKEEFFFPPLVERMLNCGLHRGPTSSRLLLAKTLEFFLYQCSKSVRLLSVLVLPLGTVIWCKGMSVLASSPRSPTKATWTENNPWTVLPWFCPFPMLPATSEPIPCAF